MEEKTKVSMSGMNAVELGSVQKTLLLPLWGRAVETGEKRALLVDEAAARIVATIEYDFSTMARKISPITRLAWIARSLHIDHTIRQFVEQHSAATIVNLGCGLDTTFERVDNGKLRWYDLDLPDVIELRSRYIQQGARRGFIACSVLDDTWIERVEVVGSVLFVAAGVLYYFSESQVKAIFTRLADKFPGGELVFDACSPRGVTLANKKVIRDGGMDDNAQLKWGLGRADEIHEWDPRITIVAEYPIFRGMRSGLTFKEKYGTFLSDALRIMSMVHLRIENEREQ